MNTPIAIIKRTKKVSSIWLIPIVAVLIGAWMVYDHISNQGFLITIEFDTAAGLEKGKTQIKTKNVVIGKVIDIQLIEQSSKIQVSARIDNKQSVLLDKDSHFWIVKPRIGNQGISGLETLLSGAYIALSPGKTGEQHDKFVGLESPPVTPLGTPGLHITLSNNGDTNFHIGTPIIYRGITVGKIEHVFFNTEERTVYYNAFIESPHDALITTNTHFWEINGVEVNLSADGIRLQTGTLETMLTGGISFGIPSGEVIGEKITQREYFEIYPYKDAINDQHYKHSIEYILLFADSIRGLNVQAPVEFRGVKVGHVTRTDMNYPNIGNLLDKNTLIPIRISIQPARMGLSDDIDSVNEVREKLDSWLKKGLHAGLSTGNLLTGSKIIDLQYSHPNDLPLQTFNGDRVIPSVASSIDLILLKANKIMDKIYQLPLDTLTRNINETIIEATDTLKTLQKSATEVEKILSDPESHQLVNKINDLIRNVNSVTENFSRGEPGQKALQENMDSLKQVLDQLQPLLLQLNQQPNSLIFSGEKNEDIEPKGVKE